jgi:hypothetical protein
MKAEPLPVSSESTPAVKENKIDFKGWFNGLGLHGKLLAGGAVLGVICAFLPLVSISVGSVTVSAMLIDYWMGVISLIACIACGAAAWLLYQPTRSSVHRQLTLGVLGSAALVVLFALLMVVKARSAIGFGAILNLVAAAGIGAGAFLKAKDEKVF